LSVAAPSGGPDRFRIGLPLSCRCAPFGEETGHPDGHDAVRSGVTRPAQSEARRRQAAGLPAQAGAGAAA